jgi:uncharacterized protein with FMN-binding domain
MRRVVLTLALTLAVLVAVLRYHSPPTGAPIDKAEASPRPAPSTSPSSAAGSGVFTGPRVRAYQPKMGYSFGDVQVVLTMQGGRIVSVASPIVPPDGDTGAAGTRPITQSISAFAVPLLRSEALRAQSAQIQAVSGATYTADAFISSLQAALLSVRR